jgi:hypothetical protein
VQALALTLDVVGGLKAQGERPWLDGLQYLAADQVV